MSELETTLCPRCKGSGQFRRSYLPYPLICERCEGTGVVYVPKESWRAFRRRVIEGR